MKAASRSSTPLAPRSKANSCDRRPCGAEQTLAVRCDESQVAVRRLLAPAARLRDNEPFQGKDIIMTGKHLSAMALSVFMLTAFALTPPMLAASAQPHPSPAA